MLNSIICDYGCGQPAKYIFKNGRPCCSKTYHSCPANRERLRKKQQQNSSHAKLYDQLNRKELQCYICGEPASYLVSDHRPCCCKKATECPQYGEYIGDKQREWYRQNPEYLEWQRSNIKEFSSRPETSQKKSEAMLKLHSEDEDFQWNYSQGREQFRKLVKKLSENGDHWAGDGTGYAAKRYGRLYFVNHKKARQLFLKDACEFCGKTQKENKRETGKSLSIHCVNGDSSDFKPDNWETYCNSCHTSHEANIRKTKEYKKILKRRVKNV